MGSYKWGKSRVITTIAHIRGLIFLLITTREPPSRLVTEMRFLLPHYGGILENLSRPSEPKEPL